MSEAVPLLLRMPSQHGERQLHFLAHILALVICFQSLEILLRREISWAFRILQKAELYDLYSKISVVKEMASRTSETAGNVTRLKG